MCQPLPPGGKIFSDTSYSEINEIVHEYGGYWGHGKLLHFPLGIPFSRKVLGLGSKQLVCNGEIIFSHHFLKCAVLGAPLP